jgi:hypothetical protein
VVHAASPVVSEAHDQGPQPVPRYLDQLNGRDRRPPSSRHTPGSVTSGLRGVPATLKSPGGRSVRFVPVLLRLVSSPLGTRWSTRGVLRSPGSVHSTNGRSRSSERLDRLSGRDSRRCQAPRGGHARRAFTRRPLARAPGTRRHRPGRSGPRRAPPGQGRGSGARGRFAGARGVAPHACDCRWSAGGWMRSARA